ncbi:hypothetical protein GCM10027422_23200 [Hymenobacter arcticus]
MAVAFEIDLLNGYWVCRWISNLRYEQNDNEEGVSLICQANYESRKIPVAYVHHTVYGLFALNVGLGFQVKDKTAIPNFSNAQRDKREGKPHFIVNVFGESLTTASAEIHNHLGLSEAGYNHAIQYDIYLKEAVEKLHLPDNFACNYAHLVTNEDSNLPADYFIIPSYEVLRYFFLQGSILSKELLTYFTSPAEQASHSITDLVAHPTLKPTIYMDGKKRVATLLIREGLREEDINCLGRIAFSKQASKCLSMIRNSLLLNSSGSRDHSSNKLRTLFPQDNPFKLGVSGRRFTWMGKNYVLVDQIYDTAEDMGFDKIVYLPMTDRRSQKSLSKGQKDKIKKSPKTVPTPATILTENAPGNRHQQAEIDVFVETLEIFKKKLELPIKLEKRDQQNRYKTTEGIIVPQDIISILEKGKADQKAGRAKLYRRSGYSSESNEAFIFFSALAEINGYQVFYFNLDEAVVSFAKKHHLNKRLLSAVSRFDVLLCQFIIDNYNIYLAWANNKRYALFYDKSLFKIDDSILEGYCNDSFRKDGVYTNEIGSKSIIYGRHNQRQVTSSAIAKKIENQLNGIVNKRKSRPLY